MNHPGEPRPAGGPRIPPPPSRVGMGRKRDSDRLLLWPGALAVGVALGFAAYRWLPGIDFYFDYWLALVLT